MTTNNKKFELKIFMDRYDDEYRKTLANLLDIRNLSESAIPNGKKDEIKDGIRSKYDKYISIHFCGLSALSLIGGVEAYHQRTSKSAKAFLDLISNKGGCIKELNDRGIYVDIKFLFAYPYSDFMYDLILAETERQEGFSINCIKDRVPYDTVLNIPKKLSYATLTESKTYQNLVSSLRRLQEYGNKSKDLFNLDSTPNKIVIKFTPLNILLCYLKINNNIFLDPYIYTKEFHDKELLALTSPVSAIEIPYFPIKTNKLSKHDEQIFQHFCSAVSHFKYLWKHPTTIYCNDATDYSRDVKDTLHLIKEPHLVSFFSKAKRLKKLTLHEIYQSELDLWKQYCKKELIRYCSKFVRHSFHEIDVKSKRHIKVKHIPIFIVGSWRQGDTSNYMDSINDFIKYEFGIGKNKGLGLDPIIVDADDGEDIVRLIYDNLNLSQLGIVIQTGDLSTENEKSKHSKPNVYYEKGYLMGRLGRKPDRFNREKSLVMVFKEYTAHMESDNSTLSYTPFEDIADFKNQFFRVVKWLWDITELDSEYALELLKKYKETLRDEHKNAREGFVKKLNYENDEKLKIGNDEKKRTENELLDLNSSVNKLWRYLKKVDSFINEIETWIINNSDNSIVHSENKAEANEKTELNKKFQTLDTSIKAESNDVIIEILKDEVMT
jgi:hypothetical protein